MPITLWDWDVEWIPKNSRVPTSGLLAFQPGAAIFVKLLL